MSSSISSSSGSAHVSPSKFDVGAYIAPYRGHTRLQRLSFIANRPDSGGAGSRKAFAMLVDECVQGGTNVELYEASVTKAQRQFGAESFPVDTDWTASARARSNETLEKLERGIKAAKINSVKEIIRVGQNDLGMFLVQCGRMTQAMRTFQKNKDYASAPAHMLEYARNLLACAVYTSAWTQAGNHVSKLQQYLRKESNPTAQAGCYALTGLSI